MPNADRPSLEPTPFPIAPALLRVLHEADDIARATGQRVTTAHALLAFFTTRNHAERLLRDRGIDEDRLLDLFRDSMREPKHLFADVLGRAAQVAAGCGARVVDCLHLLVAMTREREAIAFMLLEATGEKLGHLRTRALTILTGAVPRWLEGPRVTGRPMRVERLERALALEASSAAPQPSRREGREDREPAPPRNASPAAGSSKRESSPLPGRSLREGPRPTNRENRRVALDWSPPLVRPSSSKPLRRKGSPAPEVSSGLARPDPKKSAAVSLPPRAPLGGAHSALPSAAPSAAPSRPAPIARSSVIEAEKDDRPFAPRGAPASSSEPARDDPALSWLLSPAEYPWLTSLGRNLSALAARGGLDRLVGREKEVEELIDILGKRRANNPCLIGEPGVGKTAVVEGLAHRLIKNLSDRIIIGLDVGGLLVGTHLRGSFSEKLQGLKEEVKQSGGRVIVFFDELHTLVGAGSTGDGPQDAANELKSALARGDFPCIGATTHAEYIKHIEPDASLKRRFYPVLIKEPTQEEAIRMLEHIAPEYAAHHGVTYTKEALAAAVHLSARYITDRHLPDKAIALIDLAGSRAARAGKDEVDKELVAALVSERTDLPIERLLSSDRQRLLQLEAHLEREIVGHRPQLHRIADVIRRNAAGFSSRRPQGAFLFLGPTGVGKTETAKAIAKVLHGSEDSMIRFDLSEFSEPHAVARLVGAPPGYVGHDAGGQLTEAVRRRPGRVVLFDEIEKAHKDVLQILLQILDEGRVSDGRGQTVSFAETIVILTSNLGADLSRVRRPIGFGGSGGTPEERAEYSDAVLAKAREHLPPELWSRIEERLVFGPLTKDELREIARLLAADSSRRLSRDRGISYALDDRAVDYLLEQGGYDLTLGARTMRQIMSRIVEAPIAARILEGRLHADEHVLVSVRPNGGLAFLVGDERTSLSQRPPR